MNEPCEGPLIWYDVESGGAVLECVCGYIIVSGSFNDEAHTQTPIMREGLRA